MSHGKLCYTGDGKLECICELADAEDLMREHGLVDPVPSRVVEAAKGLAAVLGDGPFCQLCGAEITAGVFCPTCRRLDEENQWRWR
jgi:hypothetical protein